jgi:hypothetical protein
VHQRLDAQDDGVHESDGIHRVQGKALQGADLAGGDQVVVAAVGIGDARAAGG